MDRKCGEIEQTANPESGGGVAEMINDKIVCIGKLWMMEYAESMDRVSFVIPIVTSGQPT